MHVDGPSNNTDTYLRGMSIVFHFEKTWRCAVRLPPFGVPVHAAPPIHVSYHVSYYVSYHMSYHVSMMAYARLFS